MSHRESKKTVNYFENFQKIIKQNYKKRVIYLENDIVFIMNLETMNVIKKDSIIGCTINKNLFIHLKHTAPIEISLNEYDHSFGVEIIAFIYNILENSETKVHDYYS